MHWWEGSLLNQNMQYETVYLIFWGAMKWDLKFIFRKFSRRAQWDIECD